MAATPFDLDGVRCLGRYRPYWIWGPDGTKERNPAFDRFSDELLNLKHKPGDKAREQAAAALAPLVKAEVPPGAVLVTVPSHDPANNDSGTVDIAKELGKHGVASRPDMLVRTTKVPKLANGGDRSEEVHLRSIRVSDPDAVRGKDVVVLDDVTTTGNSLKACRALLLKAGARSVKLIAIGKTTHGS